MADDEIGARVDRSTREADRVAPVLAEVPLGAGSHVLAVGPLGAHVGGDDHDVGALVGVGDCRANTGQVGHRLRPRVRREAEHGDADGTDLLTSNLAGLPGVLEAGAVERLDGVLQTGLAEVMRMVVGQVEHGEARRPGDAPRRPVAS